MGIAPEANMPQGALIEALHGLVPSTDGPSETPERWESGFAYKAESCTGSTAWNPCTPRGEAARSKDTQTDTPGEFDYQPFVAYTPITCSSFGWEAADYKGRAERALAATASAAVEREFWMGEAIPTNPHLRDIPWDDDHILNPGGIANLNGVSPAQALILLTGALANCLDGTIGNIHATAAMAEAMLQGNMIRENADGRLVTAARGDIVIAGSGYPGDGPYDAPPLEAGQAWVYATGIVNHLLGEPEVFPDTLAEALDRQTNTITFRGERTAAAWHDGCCTFAVLVNTVPYTADVVPCPVPDGQGVINTEMASQWIEDGTGFGIPGNILFIGVNGFPGSVPVDLSPDGLTMYAHVGDAPIVGTPTVADIPSDWTATFPAGGDSNPAFIFSLSFVPPEWSHVPAWIKMEGVNAATGCTWRYLIYMPDGIPDTWEDDVTFFGQWVDAAAPIPNTDPHGFAGYTITGGTEDQVTGSLTIHAYDCPDPTKGLAITQACPDTPLTVEVTNTTPIPVTFDGVVPTNLRPAIASIEDASRTFASFRSLTVTVTEGTITVTDSAGSVTVPAGVTMTWGADFSTDVFVNTIDVASADVGNVAIVNWTEVV